MKLHACNSLGGRLEVRLILEYLSCVGLKVFLPPVSSTGQCMIVRVYFLISTGH